MDSRRIGRYLPLMAVLAAGLLAVGCSSNGGGPSDPVGGSGGTGGGGDGGTGGSGCDLDGEPDPGEDCDDGNTVDTDCCSNTCQVVNPTCGNDHIECGEDCDDGNTAGGDGCSTICKTERCGNGYPETVEECDDGNNVSGDGCSADCKVECLRDQDCDKDAMEVCVRASAEDQYGACLPEGAGCNADNHCGPPQCVAGTCYCAPNENGDAFAGVCWKRVESCHGCETDAECGSSIIFDRPARCVTYHLQGQGDQKLCLPKNLPSQNCPSGMVAGGPDDGGLDLTGFCVPMQHMCPVDKCEKDADCTDPRFPVCDLQRQVCIPGCYINWTQDRETVGCSPSKPACHAMPERFDPYLLTQCNLASSFGYGKCGIECVVDSDCAHRGNDVNGNPYVCKDDGGIHRCRPDGCVDDMECAEPTDGGIYLGYCDPFRQACTWDNCRVGPDPRTTCVDPYDDCKTTHKCVADDGQPEGWGICIEKNCIDNGGAVNDCKGGQFCAGEPMKSMMTREEEGEPLPLPDGVSVGDCYDMDTPVWCSTTCTPGDNSSCRLDTQPGRHADNPGYCMPTEAGGQCNFGCKYAAECPALWSCASTSLQITSDLAPATVPTGLKLDCESDLDCGAGNSCVFPMVSGALWDSWGYVKDPATGQEFVQQPFKVCSCKNTGQCGGGATCNEGIATRDPDHPEVGVERYCTFGSKELCGTGGTLEWWGDSYLAQDGSWQNTFKCSCGPGSESTCPAIGPQGTIMQDSPTRCGQNLRDRYLCVGGQVCEPKLFPPTPPETGDPYCGVRRDP